MPPQQQYGPTPPPQPQRAFEPHAPETGYKPGSDLQQHPSGQYEVVPPLPVASNDGHTGHNPYDFIMNPNSAKPIRGGALGGDVFLKRIGLLVGGVVVIFIIGAILFSKLAPKGNVADMTSVAQRQQEIIRIATAAILQANSQDAKNFVTNVQVTVTSSQQQLLAYMTANGIKVSTTVLGLDKSSQTDTLLANAASANNYDSTVTQNLTQQLQNYESLLQTAYHNTSGKNGRALLQSDFSGANLLIKQAKTLSLELQ